jgi:divalent metal cation (Fe/Co/Zn/Cd) transporter
MVDRKKIFEKGEKAARLSTAILLVFGIFKRVVAVLSGSMALLTGAIEIFSDVFSSLAV